MGNYINNVPPNKNVIAREGEMLGSGLDFYTFKTTLNISRGPFESEGQQRLNRLIEVIGIRAQPIIVAIHNADFDDPPEFPNETGTVTVYTLKFAIEHIGAWDTEPDLLQELNGQFGFDFLNTYLAYHADL
jgi:hypothetical protein